MSSMAYPSALNVLGTPVFLVLNLNRPVLCRYCCLDTLPQSAKTTGIWYQVCTCPVGFIEPCGSMQDECITSIMYTIMHTRYNTAVKHTLVQQYEGNYYFVLITPVTDNPPRTESQRNKLQMFSPTACPMHARTHAQPDPNAAGDINTQVTHTAHSSSSSSIMYVRKVR